MVNWQINRIRQLSKIMFTIGVPIGVILLIFLAYGYHLRYPYQIGPLISVILILGGSIGMVLGLFLGWKYIFAKFPKYIGISDIGIHFSDTKDEYEDCINWNDILKIKTLRIKTTKTTQQSEIKTIILKNGTKRELVSLHKDDIKRIINAYEKYKK